MILAVVAIAKVFGW